MIDQVDFNSESGYPSVSVVERVDINESLVEFGGNIHRIRRGQLE